MTRFPGVHRRADSNKYQFVLKPPKDLQHHFDGQWAVRCSLGTADLREANDKARALQAEWALKFEALRKADNPQPVPMNAALASSIAAEVRRWVLEADDNMRAFPEVPRALAARQERARVLALAEELADSPLAEVLPPRLFNTSLTIGGHGVPARDAAPTSAPGADPFGGLTESQHEAIARLHAADEGQAAVDLARRNLRAALPLADAVAKSMGLVIEWTDEAGKAALLECLKAYRTAMRDLTRRDAGEVIETPAIQPRAIATAPQPAAPGGHSFQQVFEAWRDAKPGRPRKSLMTYEAAARKLEALLPRRTVESLTPEDGRVVVAALLEAAQAKGGKAQNTAGNLLGRFKTLMGEAEKSGWIERDPFARRSIESVDSDRSEWSPADLTRLFDDPLFTAYRLPTNDARAGLDAAYFLPLLGLYTGARVSELAQLDTTDLSITDDAGAVLDIRADADKGQRVKTKSSARRVRSRPPAANRSFIGLGTLLQEPLKRCSSSTRCPRSWASRCPRLSGSRPPRRSCVRLRGRLRGPRCSDPKMSGASGRTPAPALPPCPPSRRTSTARTATAGRCASATALRAVDLAD